MNTLEENMVTVERLCQKYERSEHSQWINEFLSLYHQDMNLFFGKLAALDFWGKLFCIGDASTFSPPRNSSITKNESLTDTELQQRALVIIYEEMVKAGYEHPKIKQMTDVYKHWAEIDVYKKWKT
jgi:hypothetical protein